MPERPKDSALQINEIIPIYFIDDKVKVKQALDKMYGDISFVIKEAPGFFSIWSTQDGPQNLLEQLQEAGVVRYSIMFDLEVIGDWNHCPDPIKTSQ
ncbi:hypothetical protein ACHAPT_007297 [Fusarium lateritium]